MLHDDTILIHWINLTNKVGSKSLFLQQYWGKDKTITTMLQSDVPRISVKTTLTCQLHFRDTMIPVYITTVKPGNTFYEAHIYNTLLYS